MWRTDRDGKIIPNKPEDSFNHTMDAIRYGLENFYEDQPLKEIGEEDGLGGVKIPRYF